MRLVAAVFLVLTLAGCAGRPSLDDAPLSTRDFALEDFFDGPVVGYGQFQDRFGTVRRRFRVEVNGAWDCRTLTLDERFAYADGSTETRVWTLEKTGPETWRGSAPGVIGTAKG